jgi:hypothetical protein
MHPPPLLERRAGPKHSDQNIYEDHRFGPIQITDSLKIDKAISLPLEKHCLKLEYAGAHRNRHIVP